MRRLLWAAVLTAAAVALNSCDPQVIEVKDTRELTGVELKVNDESSTWAAGETRYFTVEISPKNAVVTKITLEPNISGLVEISQGDMPNRFIVMARKAGKVKLIASVMDQNGILKTDDKSFNISGNYVPKMGVWFRRQIEGVEHRAMPKEMVCNVGDLFEMVAASDYGKAAFSLSSSNPEVMAIGKGDGCWILSAKSNGNVRLTVTLTDEFGTKREKVYTAYVYGHTSLKAEFKFSTGAIGLSVLEYAGEPTGAFISIDGSMYGWPDGHPNMKVTSSLASLKDYQEWYPGASYPEMYSVQWDLDQMLSRTPYRDNTGTYYYDIHGLTLVYTIALDDPYIIIDEITENVGSSYGISFRPSVVQEGLEENSEVPDDEAEITEMPDQVGHDGNDGNDGHEPGIDSWKDGGDIHINL